MSLASYLLSLCEATQESCLSFGSATRLDSDTQDSTFNVDVTKVIHSIVTFSPAPESVAIQLLQEFRNVSGIKQLVEPVLSHNSEFSPHQWAQEILQFFRNLSAPQLLVELNAVRSLVSEYFTHLLVAAGRKKNPQESACSTPKTPPTTTGQIQALINKAVSGRKQSPLKLLIYRRDGYHCPLTDFSFDPRDDFVMLQCAHILPFSLYEQNASLNIIEAFTRHTLSSKTMLDSINHPRNAFNVQTDAHDSFVKLTWGIEAVDDDAQWKYIFRKLPRSAATIRRKDGDELIFNKGEHGMAIDGPDPAFCNLKLALARALHACGAADIIAETFNDDDEEAIVIQPAYFGGPFVSDDILCRRLDD